LANAVLLYFLIMALWSFWRYFRKQSMDSSYRGALVVSAVLAGLQALLGVLLWFNDSRPDGGSIHVLYGLFAALSLPGVYSWINSRSIRQKMLIYAVCYLFLVGISFRLLATG
jgi:hypothetical protein